MSNYVYNVPIRYEVRSPEGALIEEGISDEFVELHSKAPLTIEEQGTLVKEAVHAPKLVPTK